MHLLTSVVAALPLVTSSAVAEPAPQPPAKKMNVLFIAIDDLRPELGCYGHPHMVTPHIDAVAARSLLFNRAYCQQAVCTPSRVSVMTGRRPDTTRVYELRTHFRTTIPDVITLPQHFKNHGYHAQGFGKIYHGGQDDEASWSPAHTPWPGVYALNFSYGSEENIAALEARRERFQAEGFTGPALNVRLKGPAWESADVADHEMPDGMTTEQAIEAMNQVKDKPFFLAVGFIKPHLPFAAPKRYFDLYPPADQIELPQHDQAPQDMPELALIDFDELRTYEGIPKTGPIPEQQARELIRAYYACTSYVDAQIGKLVAELDRLGLREKTIIVIWGDHGYHLGEQGMWTKQTNFENAARVPLIIEVPGMTTGHQSDALVELVDIFPTLSELAGLQLPEGLEGTSLVPLLVDPARPWKAAAFSQYPRPREQNAEVMGYSIRTDRYRYTEWQTKWQTPEQASVIARELYDHHSDPDETINIADHPDQGAVIDSLSQQLNDGWRAATPLQ